MNAVNIGGRMVGKGHPVFIIAEIGINHNGDRQIAKQLIDIACTAGCDAVKLQKRTPEICTPDSEKDRIRETPWGTMTYLEYRHRVEFSQAEIKYLSDYCKTKNILCFFSCWDEPSVEVVNTIDPPCYKVASACLTDLSLISKKMATGKPLIVSTGMSTLGEIETALELIGDYPTVLMHTTSSYPTPNHEVNLKMISALERYGMPVGYSGHEAGLQISLAAVALGAVAIERHITVDRTMWGSDQAASLEPTGLFKLVRDIRIIEKAMGDGIKQVYKSELPIKQRLRRK